MYKLIKKLQQAGDLYNIVECGTAASISDAILSVPGASAMIECCLQPYSKESQIAFLGKDFERSVSKEWVIDALNKVETPTIITQFQVQNDDLNTLPHGWIGVRGKFGTAIYHMSIYRNYAFDNEETYDVDKRAHYLQDIQDTCITLMYKHSVDPHYPISNLYLDGVWNDKGDFNFDAIIEILGQTDKVDTMFVLNNGQWSRLEDFGRGQDGIILLRGSFNPVHEGHTTMMKLAKEQFPTYNGAYVISIHNCRKPAISAIDARTRMETINKLGEPVIFCSLAMFNDSSRLIYERWDFLPVIYPVGIDTVNRFADDEAEKQANSFKSLADMQSRIYVPEAFDAMVWKHFQSGFWKNHKFLVFKRNGMELNENAKVFSDYMIEEKTWKDENAISSTKIRNEQNK